LKKKKTLFRINVIAKQQKPQQAFLKNNQCKSRKLNAKNAKTVFFAKLL
jgi:hypothetical protein